MEGVGCSLHRGYGGGHVGTPLFAAGSEAVARGVTLCRTDENTFRAIYLP